MSRGGITPHTSAGPKKGRPPNPPSPVQSTTKPQRNDQEEIWECICSLGKKIRKDFKKSGKIQSSLKELDNDIQCLLDDIVKEEKKQDNGSVIYAKTKEKDKSPKDTKQKNSVKEEEIDLLSLFKAMKHEKIQLNRDFNAICEKIFITGKDLGIDVVDEKQHDVNISKEAITCLLAENRKLSFILNKLNKEFDGSKDQHKKYTKVLKKLKASSKSDKQNSDLSDDSPFTVFTAFYNHVPRIIEILKNESLLQEQKRNEQEEIWDCICSLGKKIRIDFKKSATIQSTLRELEEDIQDLNLFREKLSSTGKILGMKTGDGKSNDVNSSRETEEYNFAQCPIQDAHWSSEKEKKLLSLQEQNKSHEDSLITLLNAKRDMADENSNLKRKLEESERNFLKKSKEADNLICEKQTLEDNFKKRLDLETRHQLAQMQMEMQTRVLTSYK